jgi:hypothetical protein
MTTEPRDIASELEEQLTLIDLNYPVDRDHVAGLCRASLAEIRRLGAENEAARRYFAHCRRTISSLPRGPERTAEMDVRLALMKEAQDALGIE